MTSSFECLYFLDNDQFCIVEIKLADLPADTQGTNRLKWLMVSKGTLEVKTLHFQSMDSSHEIEERFFDLGYLKFDAEKGVFISKESAAHSQLGHIANEEIPTEIMEAIARYLNGDGIIFL